MSRQIIAIDIRDTFITAVVLDKGLKANTVTACSHASYNGDSTSTEGLENAITELIADIPRDNAILVLALPAHSSIYRTLTVPFKDDGKIRQVLPFELEPSLPMPVDELAIGFQKEIVADQAQVLATTIEHRLLERYMKLFSDQNLQPQLVVPGSFPAVLSLIAHDAKLPEQALVLDVDNERSTLFALVSGRVCLVRSFQASIDTEGETEHLALKIRQTLTAFADAQAVDFSPSVIFLSGPRLDDPEAEARLSDALNLPTYALALHQRINKVEVKESLNYNGWLYENALATACIEAEGKDCPNFHRTSSTFRNIWASYSKHIKTPAILLAFIIIFALGGVLYDSHLHQNRLDDIKLQMEQVFKSTFPGSSLSKAPVLAQMKSKLKEAQKNIAAPIQAGNRISSIDALLEISQLLPQSISVVINRMVVSEDTISLSGETGGFNSVDDIKIGIEKSTFFKKVTIASANMDKSGKKVRFKLKIDL